MKNLSKITENIYRLTVPFLDIYTTVFLIKTSEGFVLYDTATYPEDVDQYIIPAFRYLQTDAESIAYVVLSHSHRDHAGGLDRFLELFPEAVIVTGSGQIKEKYPGHKCLMPEDGQMLTESLRLIRIPGHAADCIGLFEERTKTLLSGDSLQLYGIFGSGKWGANISTPLSHIEAVDKLKALEPTSIVASHDYHPYGYLAVGGENIEKYLEACKDALYQIRDMIVQNPDKSDEELTKSYNSMGKLPTVGEHVFRGVRNTLI